MSWLRTKAIVRRHAYVLQRAPQRWFDVVFWPVVDAILFGSIGVYFAHSTAGGTATSAGHAALGFLLTGILLFHVVFQAEISLSTGFMEETWSRNLLNLLVTPLRETEYASGVVLFGLLKMALGVSVVAAVAFVLFSFNITALGVALIPLVAVLLVIGWSVALIVIGLVLRVGQGAEILAWGLLALVMPLSGTFYPVSALPGPLRPIALALPTTHAFVAARQVIAGHGLPLGEVAIAAGGSIVLASLSVLFLLRMLATFRRRGYISRHT